LDLIVGRRLQRAPELQKDVELRPPFVIVLFARLGRADAAAKLNGTLAAVYPEREYVDDDGLLANGPSIAENFRRTADYVDRILKGTKPADLPVQQPTKFELIVSVKSAKAIGLEVLSSLLSRADVVIE
jgi:hypothetical protein